MFLDCANYSIKFTLIRTVYSFRMILSSLTLANDLEKVTVKWGFNKVRFFYQFEQFTSYILTVAEQLFGSFFGNLSLTRFPW